MLDCFHCLNPGLACVNICMKTPLKFQVSEVGGNHTFGWSQTTSSSLASRNNKVRKVECGKRPLFDGHILQLYPVPCFISSIIRACVAEWRILGDGEKLKVSRIQGDLMTGVLKISFHQFSQALYNACLYLFIENCCSILAFKLCVLQYLFQSAFVICQILFDVQNVLHALAFLLSGKAHRCFYLLQRKSVHRRISSQVQALRSTVAFSFLYSSFQYCCLGIKKGRVWSICVKYV